MNPESPWPPVFSLFCEFHHFLKVSVYHPNGSTPVAKWWVTTSQGDMGFPTSPTSEPALPHVLLGLATGSTRNRRTYNHGVCRDISMSDLCINKYIYIYADIYYVHTILYILHIHTYIYIYVPRIHNLFSILEVSSLKKDPGINQKRQEVSKHWWFQPIWTICSSHWIISPGGGENSKNVWVATT